MFKIDWPCAMGGAVLGYYTKGKVEDTKAKFKGIYTGALNTLKESFSEEDTQGQSAPQGKTGKTGKNG